MPDYTIAYGAAWPAQMDRVEIEMECIRRGGAWKDQFGDPCGAGLFTHYRNLQSLLWPEDDHHRWSDLILRTILDHTIIPILGPKDSGKTRTVSKYGLVDYYCFPNNTMTIATSTDIRGLEMRVWGDIKSLHERALNRYDVPGIILESKHAICTDDLSDDGVRDMRRGIVCVPTVSSSGTFVGLGKFIGAKQQRRRLLGDEAQITKPAFLDSIANLNSGDFKAVLMGNPLGIGDPLDRAAEPKAGWDSLGEVTKTRTWENHWVDGVTINLVGTDSPNFDPPLTDKPRYPYMINAKSIASVVAFYGKDSLTYYSQCVGIRKTGLNMRRIITRELCEQFHAFEDVIWTGGPVTKVAGADIAYGNIGGDRCVLVLAEFGEAVGGGTIIYFHEPIIVPVTFRPGDPRPEPQIAQFIQAACTENDIPPENFGYDSTGRGTMGSAFAGVWSDRVNPIEFGGRCTKRPVSLDLYTWDDKEKVRRLKRWDEHANKFVTELWYSSRYAIVADQVRGLTDDVVQDGMLREQIDNPGGKIDVEPKAKTKERMGRSPDLWDALTVALEMARRRGFQIRKLAVETEGEADGEWLRDALAKRNHLLRSKELNFRA